MKNKAGERPPTTTERDYCKAIGRTVSTPREIERYALATVKTWPEKLEETTIGETAPYPPLRAWRSRRYIVQLREVDGHPEVQLINVQRTGASSAIRPQNRDLRPISWDELQAIKAEIGFGTRWAVEVYPAEEDIVDIAAMRHLWLLPEAPSWAWRKDSI